MQNQDDQDSIRNIPDELKSLLDLYRLYEEQRRASRSHSKSEFLEELERRNPYFSRHHYTAS